ncbi:sodium-coupled monocarboxylate transporter 1-like [Mytilus trossulus]|uniref:sodium-coupled monocarboxylate transporter 1-like n=1 Tax=Mytilus trossulus TaxID=6551 RepID=UPI0030047AC2
MTTSDLHNFHAADYAVFGGMLLVSMGIGIYHACAGGKQKSTKEFLMANQSMRSLPVALSILASFFSASTLLGTPAEIYEYGTQYWVSVFGAMLAPVTGALLFGPMFFKLKVVSVFQYLEERFQSKSVRLFGALIFLVRTIIGMGIVLYGPSTALSAVTTFPEWAVILVVGGVCTFYTTIGGLKAVIWTDVFQTLVMLAGMLAVIIKGAIEVGGGYELWNIADRGKRIEFFRFDLDPHVRHTFWALTIGIYFVWLAPYTVDQQMVQRFSSARSLKDAKTALLLNVPFMFILITLCSFTGLVMFAFYADCDPLKTHEAENPNQLLPLFVVELFRDVPGIPGLFVACLFSGAMSSISSMLNSLSAVTWEDFLKLKFYKVSDERATFVTKCLVLLFGCLGIGMAFAVSNMGGSVLQASITLNGAAGAPLVGLFILGSCFTSANWIGALIGGVVGFAFPMWCGIGKYTNDPQNFKLSTSTEGCNLTALNGSVFQVVNNTELEGLQQLYGLSYIWFSSIGILIVVIVGLFVSFLTGVTEHVDENLKLHFWQKFVYCLCPVMGSTKKEKEMKQFLENLKNAPSLDILQTKKPILAAMIDTNTGALVLQNGTTGTSIENTFSAENGNEADESEEGHSTNTNEQIDDSIDMDISENQTDGIIENVSSSGIDEHNTTYTETDKHLDTNEIEEVTNSHYETVINNIGTAKDVNDILDDIDIIVSEAEDTKREGSEDNDNENNL